MDPIVALLLKNGVFGILAGVGFYLFFKERKLNQTDAQTYLRQQIADTAIKTKLAAALEDLAATVEVARTDAHEDAKCINREAKENKNELLAKIEAISARAEAVWAEEKLEREIARRTINNPGGRNER